MITIREEAPGDRTAFSRDIQAVRIVLSPSPASRTFYARLGFEPAEALKVLTL